MNVVDIIHPEDAKALKALKAVPGMSLLMEKIFQYGFDELSWSENVTTNLRLSERQMPEIYNRLPPICKRLGIPVPELYVQMSPIVNAWTSGHNRPYIILTLGLIKRVKGEELDAVLAHECGHIICEHVVYQTFANAVFSFGESFTGSVAGIFGNVAIKPIKQALISWCRASELSADRIACLIVSAETLGRVLARINLIPKYIIEEMDINEWAQQGKEFEALKDGSTWNKIVRWISNEDADHPYMPVRVYEALKWEKSTNCINFKACNSSLIIEHKEESGSSITNSLLCKTESVAQNISSLTNSISIESTLFKIGFNKKKK